MAIRILLVDDHKIMREGLRSLLEKETDFEVVAEARNGREAIELARSLKPNVVIMDVTMPELNGIEATRHIHDEFPAIKVVALTVHSDKNYLTGMLRAGTAGYLLKDCAAEELVQAVRAVADGKGYVSPEVAPMIMKDYSIRGTPSADVSTPGAELGPKEKEILQLIAEGVTTKEIANRLGISIKTVERTRTQIMDKLQLFSVAELTKYAIRLGLTPLE